MDTLIISENEGLRLDTLLKHETCLDKNDGSINIEGVGGTPPYTLFWKDEFGLSTEQSIPLILKNLAPGIYTATLTDASGCEIIQEIEIQPGVLITGLTSETFTLTEPTELTLSVFNPNTGFWRGNEIVDSINGIFYAQKKGEYIVFYQVKSCEAKRIVVIDIEPENIKLPGAFSPNGDGVNDIFRLPFSPTIKEWELTIFDRWGIEIFDSKNTGWVGKNKNGTDLPNGVYYYHFKILKNDDSWLEKAGHISLIR